MLCFLNTLIYFSKFHALPCSFETLFVLVIMILNLTYGNFPFLETTTTAPADNRKRHFSLSFSRWFSAPVYKVCSFVGFTEGKTCGCAQWCRERGSPFGVCGNGHTCICTRQELTKGQIGKEIELL